MITSLSARLHMLDPFHWIGEQGLAAMWAPYWSLLRGKEADGDAP